MQDLTEPAKRALEMLIAHPVGGQYTLPEHDLKSLLTETGGNVQTGDKLYTIRYKGIGGNLQKVTLKLIRESDPQD